MSATSAGTHAQAHDTVLLQQAVDGLVVNEKGLYADGTFGRGGHSRGILEALDANGQLLATDKDPEAEQAALELMQLDQRFHFRRGSFADLKQFAEQLGWTSVDGVLLDLGVSSPQLDVADRGFSFLKEGPLDMRMDNEHGASAAEWLRNVEEKEIARVLWEYGEERFSRRIAKAIVSEREQEAIVTTTQLAKIIADAHPRWETGKHPATKSFQAIRIHINSELDDLKVALASSFDLLSAGGRLVVISFHSLEDRMVKRFMTSQVQGEVLPKWVAVTGEPKRKARIIAKKVRASTSEIELNVRSRSAVMRILEKL